MIDETDLGQMETFWRLGGLSDCWDLLKNGRLMELIRLARLGLWAEKHAISQLTAARNELGVPQPDYPAPVTNAANHIAMALSAIPGERK